MNAALNDKRTLVQEDLIREGTNKHELEKVFQEACEGDSNLGLKQLSEYLEDDHVKTYMRILGVPYVHSMDLVRLLDADNNGEVNAQEFVKGCFELKSARLMDTSSMLQESKHMMVGVHQLLSQISQGMQLQSQEIEELKKIDVEQVRNDIFCSLTDLKVTCTTFTAACGQLQDARQQLMDKEANLDRLREDLQLATRDINGLPARLQTLVTREQSWKSKHLHNEWRQDLNDLQKTLVQQVSEILTPIQQEENSKLPSARPCSTAATDSTSSTFDTSESSSSHRNVELPCLSNFSEKVPLPAKSETHRLVMRPSRGSWGGTQKTSTRAGPWFTHKKLIALPVHKSDMDPIPEPSVIKDTGSFSDAPCCQRKSHSHADNVLGCLSSGKQGIFI